MDELAFLDKLDKLGKEMNRAFDEDFKKWLATDEQFRESYLADIKCGKNALYKGASGRIYFIKEEAEMRENDFIKLSAEEAEKIIKDWVNEERERSKVYG